MNRHRAIVAGLELLMAVAIALGILATIRIISAHGEDRTACAESQLTWEFHSYRVDGRKCWARGHPGKFRPSQLYWPELKALPITTPMVPPWEMEWRWVDPTGWTHQEK